ncbi:polyhydroxyalkanoic acid system family protein [Vulgatibacter incomptus]|uniref:Polyhydroxyalkanoic acid system protein n=1 Tax=Vulgatibacter incomptus TaxID=1391653 RepID=A0A0K1PFI4_9BACT|nr:polyhydroxyalkanoic acid system family protein [Vulgatibacter incomptus]AKU92191.1 hypothetical protein AKJ08_2578 [Vulgatibacter incomptus]
MSMHIDFPTRLPVSEAKARLQRLGEYLQAKHGIGVAWQGDEGTIRGRYLVVAIEGTVSVREGMVTFDGKDPGLLWRSKAKEYLTHKMSKYLDPAVPIDMLPSA